MPPFVASADKDPGAFNQLGFQAFVWANKRECPQRKTRDVLVSVIYELGQIRNRTSRTSSNLTERPDRKHPGCFVFRVKLLNQRTDAHNILQKSIQMLTALIAFATSDRLKWIANE
jgi:hypothetical protein